MTIAYSTTLRNSMLDLVTTDIDAGTTGGFIRIYDGTRPATGAAITTQTLLAEPQFSTVSSPAAAGGILTASAITADASANATGTASWFRVVDDLGAFVLDGDVSTVSAGTGDLQLDSTSITATQQVSVSGFVITGGNA